MGSYLNPGNRMFQQARKSEIYVDKSGILAYLDAVTDTEQKYVCVSRPRRFGKSITANMIGNFYDRTCDASEDFSGLAILKDVHWQEYANKYNVLHINMQEFLSNTSEVEGLIGLLGKALLRDLRKEYTGIDYLMPDNLMLSMKDIYEETKTTFVVVIDEWDCIFREYPNDMAAQKKYLDFLRDWLKDKAYISLAYMTGILPIKKYGTHSALNMFTEFSMENPRELAEFTGFTQEETRALCNRYDCNFEECQAWYDGYSFIRCSHIYSPKSVVEAMLSGVYDDYWNKTETYEALKVYIDMNYRGLRDSIIAMIAGGRTQIDTGSFQNDMTTFSNADDVMTLLIHLGYLGYDFDRKEVFIPNREILQEFVTATTVSSWSEIINSVKDSQQLLNATWNGDEDAVAAGIKKAHLETSHLQYNDENALSYTVSLAYYAARQYYTVVRELPSGKGFADLTFIPRQEYADKPAMIIELKWNKTADSALKQIKQKEYTGILNNYQGAVLLVGINYNKKNRRHSCRIERA